MLDYLEGNLDPLLTAELMAFLAENPGLEKLLPEYDGNYKLAYEQTYGSKHLLKKDFSDVPEINAENFDEFCIAAAEEILDTTDYKRLANYINRHVEKQYDFDIYQQLKLKADESVLFSEKAGLKKPLPGHFNNRYVYYALSIAASFALLLILISRRPAETMHTINMPVDKTKKVDLFIIPSPVFSSAKQVEKSEKTAGTAAESITVTAPVMDNNIQMLAPERKIIALTSLKPITNVKVISSQHQPKIISHFGDENTANITHKLAFKNAPVVPEKFKDSNLGSWLIKKLNLWKAAETAVSGFNYLTESQVTFERKTDESGKLTGFIVETESYSISGNKIK